MQFGNYIGPELDDDASSDGEGAGEGGLEEEEEQEWDRDRDRDTLDQQQQQHMHPSDDTRMISAAGQHDTHQQAWQCEENSRRCTGEMQ